MDDTGATVQDTGGVVGNDWTSMLGNVTDTLTNAYVSVVGATKNQSGAAPAGGSAIKQQNPNPPPGFFGSFPQNQVNVQGNPGASLFNTLTGTGMGLLVLALGALFLLRR